MICQGKARDHLNIVCGESVKKKKKKKNAHVIIFFFQFYY